MAKAEKMRSEKCRAQLNEKIDEDENLDLPFITKRGDHIIFWDVESSGDYALDCQQGRRYASLAMEHMIKEDFVPIFTWAIMDMPRKEDASGIEVGFLEFFAEISIYTDKRQLTSAFKSDK
jgi:hypothetical protein